ncbi:amidohydrolase family protein [Lachnospiraceae bacterium 62-35]
MRVYDGHIHLGMPGESKKNFMASASHAGLSGSMMISPEPGSMEEDGCFMPWQRRLDMVLKWSSEVAGVIPFFWINPMEKDADKQVETAVREGAAGFKAICTGYPPGGDRAMRIWKQIAEAGKPLLFHTGILVGTGNSEYCRPLHYEPLLLIPGLRLCMAHVSWPWCDECIGMFAKWNNCRMQGSITSQLYLDTTPGATGICRQELLAKLYGCSLPVEDKLIFGTDLRNRYDEKKAESYILTDQKILEKLRIGKDLQERYFSKNLLDFVETIPKESGRNFGI